jgi:hypothetical protein
MQKKLRAKRPIHSMADEKVPQSIDRHTLVVVDVD